MSCPRQLLPLPHALAEALWGAVGGQATGCWTLDLTGEAAAPCGLGNRRLLASACPSLPRHPSAHSSDAAPANKRACPVEQQQQRHLHGARSPAAMRAPGGPQEGCQSGAIARVTQTPWPPALQQLQKGRPHLPKLHQQQRFRSSRIQHCRRRASNTSHGAQARDSASEAEARGGLYI